jgi:hypothetical protein
VPDRARELRIEPRGIGELEQRAAWIDGGEHDARLELLAALDGDALNAPRLHADRLGSRGAHRDAAECAQRR